MQAINLSYIDGTDEIQPSPMIKISLTMPLFAKLSKNNKIKR